VIRRRPYWSADERILRRTALRIGLQTAAGVAVTVLVLAGVAVLVVLHSQHDAQNNLINAAITQADDVVDPPAGTWLIVRRGAQQAASPGLPAGLPDDDQLRRTLVDHASRTADDVVGGREYLVRTEPYGAGGAIQVVLDLRADHAERSRLLEALLVAGSLGLLLAAGGGAWLGRRAVAPLAEALALQRRFVADAGHELRTPLTLLSTRAQLIRRRLRQDADPAALKSDVDSLVRDAALLASILDDLLLTADPREHAARESVDLPELIGEAADAAQPAADRKGVTLITEVVTGPPPVTGSSASLRRAVTALLDNAVRHARTEVRLAIGVHRKEVFLDVTDDGPGVDPDVLHTLFDRFAAGPAEGTGADRRRYGLGLALVSEIAGRHGGSVSAANTAHGGATFRLALPVPPRMRHQENSQNSPAR
jgi:two-component system OmpR family sensor kinase